MRLDSFTLLLGSCAVFASCSHNRSYINTFTKLRYDDEALVYSGLIKEKYPIFEGAVILSRLELRAATSHRTTRHLKFSNIEFVILSEENFNALVYFWERTYKIFDTQ